MKKQQIVQLARRRKILAFLIIWIVLHLFAWAKVTFGQDMGQACDFSTADRAALYDYVRTTPDLETADPVVMNSPAFWFGDPIWRGYDNPQPWGDFWSLPPRWTLLYFQDDRLTGVIYVSGQAGGYQAILIDDLPNQHPCNNLEVPDKALEGTLTLFSGGLGGNTP